MDSYFYEEGIDISKMKLGSLDSNERVIIIAEIGNNHEGSYDLACELLELAASGGADVVKFQTFIPELYVSRNDTARFERLKKFQLSFDEFRKLYELATKLNVTFLSTPFDLVSADFLGSISPGFKIGSGENTFWPLIEKAAEFGKPIIFSSGLSEIATIKEAINRIEGIWRKNATSSEIAVLHCVSSYPTPPEQANLRAITTLRNELDCDVGYSDHTLGITACLGAVALGARILEKHFTKDKNLSDFRDHQLSASPDELKELVLRVRELELMFGTGEKRPQLVEAPAKISMRRSIASSRHIRAGSTLIQDDITWIRPGDGLPPGSEHRLIGKRAKSDIQVGELLKEEMFE